MLHLEIGVEDRALGMSGMDAVHGVPQLPPMRGLIDRAVEKNLSRGDDTASAIVGRRFGRVVAREPLVVTVLVIATRERHRRLVQIVRSVGSYPPSAVIRQIDT